MGSVKLNGSIVIKWNALPVLKSMRKTYIYLCGKMPAYCLKQGAKHKEK